MDNTLAVNIKIIRRQKPASRLVRLQPALLLLTWLAFFWLSQPGNVAANSYPEALNLADLVSRAKRIFVGEVLSRTTGKDSLGHPATVYTFKIERVLKGVVKNRITIKQIGVANPVEDPDTGVITFPMDGIPVYQRKHRYLLFLNGTSEIGFTSPVGMNNGAFVISPDGSAVNGLNNAGLFREDTVPLSPTADEVPAHEHGSAHLSGLIAGDLLEHKRGPMNLSDLLEVTTKLVGMFPSSAAPSVPDSQAVSAHHKVAALPLPRGNVLELFNGHPFRWNIPSAANPGGSLPAIPYDTETGTLGSASNASAKTKVAESFAKWAAPSTTTVVVTDTPGSLGVDVDANCPSPTCYLNWYFVFGDGKSPIIFDNDGSIINAITGSPCGVGGKGGFQGTTTDGGLTWTLEGTAILNGAQLGGVCGNRTLDQFGGLITHEAGHFLGIHHTIVNGELMIAGESFLDSGVPPCASLEVMISNGVPGCTRPNVLQKDDVSIVSSLYPSADFAATTGKITGKLFAPDGVTPVNCGNMILRNLNDPFFDAVATITGISEDIGTPPAGQTGFYQAPGLTLGANYIVGVNQITSFGNFTSLCDPIPTLSGPEEFYSGPDESSDSNIDNPICFTPVTAATAVTDIDIILNSSSSSNAPCAGQITLTVTKTGTGNGTVASSPPGVNCGGSCIGSYNQGTIVTLTAASTGNSLFAGWSGGGCSGRGTCIVTMNGDTTITATFVTPIALAALTLAKGEVGVAYNAPLVTGGVAPYAFNLVKGVFPPGLNGNTNTGVLSGTPTPSKGGSFTVKVTDQLGSSVTGTFKITILAALSISAKSLKAGTHGKSYSGTLKATGGQTPYSWSLLSGTLPTGFILNSSTGAITGVTTQIGTFNPTFNVTDSLGGAATKPLTLVIK
jgi:hypothetical protein